jgi:hypothetical protein
MGNEVRFTQSGQFGALLSIDNDFFRMGLNVRGTGQKH